MQSAVTPRAAFACLLVAMLAAGESHADQSVLSNGAITEGNTLLIGDKKHWGTVVHGDPISSASGYLSVTPDGDAGSLNASWNGKGEAQLFVAHSEPRDYTGLLEQDAALVVLMQVLSPPKKKVTLRMGCGYPCAANADIGKLLKALPGKQWLRVSFDLKCFADSGLDVGNVDTPLLLITSGKLMIEISDVELVPGLGPEATIRCR